MSRVFDLLRGLTGNSSGRDQHASPQQQQQKAETIAAIEAAVAGIGNNT